MYNYTCIYLCSNNDTCTHAGNMYTYTYVLSSGPMVANPGACAHVRDVPVAAQSTSTNTQPHNHTSSHYRTQPHFHNQLHTPIHTTIHHRLVSAYPLLVPPHCGTPPAADHCSQALGREHQCPQLLLHVPAKVTSMKHVIWSPCAHTVRRLEEGVCNPCGLFRTLHGSRQVVWAEGELGDL